MPTPSDLSGLPDLGKLIAQWWQSLFGVKRPPADKSK